MNNHLLKDVIDLLRQLRSQWHDEPKPSDAALLDEAIRKLEELEAKGLKPDHKAQIALQILDKVLLRIPQLQELMSFIIKTFGE